MEKRGGREQAKEEVNKILASHIPSPMDPAVEKELLSIIQEVEKRCLGEGKIVGSSDK